MHRTKHHGSRIYRVFLFFLRDVFVGHALDCWLVSKKGELLDMPLGKAKEMHIEMASI